MVVVKLGTEILTRWTRERERGRTKSEHTQNYIEIFIGLEPIRVKPETNNYGYVGQRA